MRAWMVLFSVCLLVACGSDGDGASDGQSGSHSDGTGGTHMDGHGDPQRVDGMPSVDSTSSVDVAGDATADAA